MKSPAIFAVGMSWGVALAVASFLMWNANKTAKVHTLKQPLLVSSDKASKRLHLLPIGTTLYFGKSFPEGFTRCKIYVNIDRMPLALHELSDPTEIDPIEARVFDKQALDQALRDYLPTRQELAKIFESPHLAREDVRGVRADYLENKK